MYNDSVKERNGLGFALQQRLISYGVLSKKAPKGEPLPNGLGSAICLFLVDFKHNKL